MKKFLLILVFALGLIPLHVAAQVNFGIRAGLNIANMSVSGFTGVTESSRLGFNAGGILEIGIAKEFSLETGVLLNGKGAKFQQKFPIENTNITLIVDHTMSPTFIEIPINAIYKADLKPLMIEIVGGPYLAFGVMGNRTVEFSATNLPNGVTLEQLMAAIGVQNETTGLKYGSGSDDDLKAFDYGLNFGAGLRYNNLIFRLQYQFGLANLNPTTANNEILKSNVFSFSFGFMFGK